MQSNEVDNLVRQLTAALVSGDRSATYDPSRTVSLTLQTPPNPASESRPAPAGSGDAGRLAYELEQLRSLALGPGSSLREVAPREEPRGDGSTAQTVLKTIGLATGVGPLVAGLAALFGSRSSEPAPEPASFIAPSSIQLEGGVAADRQFHDISYSATGTARSNAPMSPRTGAGAPQAGPTIHVNVQAMDTRSFLDRSDEIAKAVREAMLHSHALNDVVSEL